MAGPEDNGLVRGRTRAAGRQDAPGVQPAGSLTWHSGRGKRAGIVAVRPAAPGRVSGVLHNTYWFYP